MGAKAVRSVRVELWDGSVVACDLSRGQGFLADSVSDTPAPKGKKRNQIQMMWTDYQLHWTTFKEE